MVVKCLKKIGGEKLEKSKYYCSININGSKHINGKFSNEHRYEFRSNKRYKNE